MQVEPLIPRRRFLKLGLACGITSIVAPFGVYQYFFKVKAHYATPYGTLLVLNKRQAEILYAASEVVLPESINSKDVLKNVVKRLDEELFFVDKQIQSDFRLALDSLQFLPLVFGKLSSFTYLSKPEQLMVYKGAMGSSSDLIRVVANNIRALLFVVFYGLDVNWEEIAYDGSFSGLAPIESVQRKYYEEATIRKGYE